MRASVLHVDSHVDPPYAPTHTHVQFEPSCCSLSPPGRMHLGGFKASILLDKPMLEDAPQYTSPSTRTFCVLKTTSESSPVLSTYTSPSSFATVTRFSVGSCATGCAVRRKAKNAVSRLGSGGRGGERDRSFDRRAATHPTLCAHDDHCCGEKAHERVDRSRRARRSTRRASTASTGNVRGGQTNDAVWASPRDPRRRERSAPSAIAGRRTHSERTAHTSASRASTTCVQARWQERRRMAPPSVTDCVP